MTRQNKYYLALVFFAFTSVISFFQINSAWADAHNFNGIFGFLGIGIVLALAAIYCLFKGVINPPGTDKH